MNEHRIKIRIWIVDANQREHELDVRKKDQETLDHNFYIGPKVKKRQETSFIHAPARVRESSKDMGKTIVP